MSDKEIEETIRSTLLNLENDKVESLLVQCSDWGINVRMFLNSVPYELDLVRNYEGYEVTFVDVPGKDPVQIDEIEDLAKTINVS